MATESKRLALYNGLRELLGEERADTLMAYLPTEPAGRLAHKQDLDRFELRFNARMEGLEARMDGFQSRMEAFEIRMDRFDTRMDRFETRMDRFETRMDRLFLAILVGLIGVMGTLLAAFFAT